MKILPESRMNQLLVEKSESHLEELLLKDLVVTKNNWKQLLTIANNRNSIEDTINHL
ncbi:MAG TPA: hypothetical protein VK084_11100 [Chitinophagaceae bacterium]|nr:hypothetical protein [Chitinophagaceae bacterium]